MLDRTTTTSLNATSFNPLKHSVESASVQNNTVGDTSVQPHSSVQSDNGQSDNGQSDNGQSDNSSSGQAELEQSRPRQSRCDRWTKGQSGTSARDRINTGFVVPEWAPSFQLTPQAKVFAIGSCFARNIEKALINQQAQVTSTDPNSDVLELRTNLLTGLLNKYNPVSIHQTLEWASGHRQFPNSGFIESEGKYIDLSLRNQARKGDLALMTSRQQQLNQHFAQIFQADLVVITLGLTETWFDRETKLALVEMPSPRLIKQYPQRFSCKRLKSSECLSVLRSIHALLKRYGQPNSKVVVTVSPVAMERTFSGQDIIVSNMMSKSTLRSAAGEWAASTEGIDYFPSYEAAMVSNPRLVWMPDRRNIQTEAVTKIVGEFIRRYGLK